MTKKKNVFAYQSVGFRPQKKKKQMVSPPNSDTRGGPPPLRSHWWFLCWPVTRCVVTIGRLALFHTVVTSFTRLSFKSEKHGVLVEILGSESSKFFLK